MRASMLVLLLCCGARPPDGTGGSTGSGGGFSAASGGNSGTGGGVAGTGGGQASGSTWRCLEGPSSCDCYDAPTNGYDKTTCGSYSCCLRQTYPGGLEECFCSNQSDCSGNSSTTRVASCP